jgi:hypothetical protein
MNWQDPTKKLPPQTGSPQTVRVTQRENQIGSRTDHRPPQDEGGAMEIRHVTKRGS